jgi:hypothetical protein
MVHFVDPFIILIFAMYGQQNIKSAYKLCLLCEGTVVGLKLPENDVNKHRNALENQLICERRTRCSARWLVDKRISFKISFTPATLQSRPTRCSHLNEHLIFTDTLGEKERGRKNQVGGWCQKRLLL